ncbi:MAG: DUF4124 domain-containing protein [Pseudomonadota bacterium]
MHEKRLVALFLLMSSMAINATGYYRCTDANGNTLFSQTSCGEKAELKTTKGNDLSDAGEGQNVFEQLKAMRSIGENANNKRSKKQASETNNNDPCDGITPLQLRNARVGGDIMRCHTKDDVTSMYGAPTHQTNWTDGTGFDTKWTYHFKESSRLIVYFSNEKVTSWSIHR